jgi:hypothetical protein
MDTKLTLKLDAEVISRAKYYAKKRKTSLSRMIESYLDSLTRGEEEYVPGTPLVDQLSGVIKLPDEFDYKEDRLDFLQNKHA